MGRAYHMILLVKIIFILQFFFLSGCFYLGKDQISDIFQKPSSEWSSRDCLTILMSGVGNNLAKLKAQTNSNIQVFATPYCPVVIEAINRTAQLRSHWSEKEFRNTTEILSKDAMGMFVDWEHNTFVDGKGARYANILQMDSLMFLVSLNNIGGAVYFPDISDLEQRILLVNGKHNYIKPPYVWGKKRNILTSIDETLLVMFQLRSGDYHFLKGSNTFSLVITGFQGMKSNDVKLDFPVALLEYNVTR